MTGTVLEWYGYVAEDMSQAAARSAADKSCPFLSGPCKKSGGACSIKGGDGSRVIVCPSRLYGDGHLFLRGIAEDAFGAHPLLLDVDGQPVLVPASRAHAKALETGKVVVGVLGHGWDSELQLPPTTDGGAKYSVDFVLVAVSPERDLLGFAPVEVQTIDTTGSYRTSLEALNEGRASVASGVGFNWENVNKRILPQLITKGLMLQGERLCTHGIYFVTTEPVFKRIAMRLGGIDRLRSIPKQPGSITFVRYDYKWTSRVEGQPLELEVEGKTTVSTSDMSIAFISPMNLPPSGAYESQMRLRLGIPRPGSE